MQILVIDDRKPSDTPESFLTDEGHIVAVAGGVEAGVCVNRPLIWFSLTSSSETKRDRCFAQSANGLELSVVMITAPLETASGGRLGAFDYVPKPVRQRTLLDITERALKHKALIDEKSGIACI
jgi:DNA-binding NtrC family response regulator